MTKARSNTEDTKTTSYYVGRGARVAYSSTKPKAQQAGRKVKGFAQVGAVAVAGAVGAVGGAVAGFFGGLWK